MQVSLRGLGVTSPEMIGYTPVLTRAVADYRGENQAQPARWVPTSEVAGMRALEDSQKFLDKCCWGPFYAGYFTDGCADYVAANRANFGEYEPCAYAASPARAAGLTPAVIAANDSNAGRLLTQESRDEATRMAQENIQADMQKHPERYGDLCPAGMVPTMAGDCAPCPDGSSAKDGVCVPDSTTSLLLIGLLVVGFLAFNR